MDNNNNKRHISIPL